MSVIRSDRTTILFFSDRPRRWEYLLNRLTHKYSLILVRNLSEAKQKIVSSLAQTTMNNISIDVAVFDVAVADHIEAAMLVEGNLPIVFVGDDSRSVNNASHKIDSKVALDNPSIDYFRSVIEKKCLGN